MKNKKIYPFERNNYFYGKLLNVRDFDDEQKYMNDKRRINNILTKGAGVVSGFQTLLLDDKTISIEAGMAIDYQGREIILEESVIKKLNVLDGFHEIEDLDHVYLGVEYSETKKEAAHSITGDGLENLNEYNRIAEGCHLFLVDKVNENAISWVKHLKTSKKILFHKNGLKITQYTPVFVKSGQTFEIRVCIEKFNLPRAIEVDYMVESDYFKTEDGKKSLRVYYCDDDIIPYKKIDLSFLMTAQETQDTDTMLTIHENTSHIAIGSENFQLEEVQKIFVKVITGEVRDAVIARYFERHFQEVLNRNSENVIYLAKFRLIKQNQEYSIIDYTWLPFQQYVLGNHLLTVLMEDNPVINRITKPSEEEVKEEQPKPQEEIGFVSGEEVIDIDLRAKNKVYFSDEIAHGLGEGPVAITVSPIEAAENNTLFDPKKSFFGNVSILQGSLFEPNITPLETAVISYPEKGTFRIAIKMLEDAQDTTVAVQWWAMKSKDVRIKDPSEVSGVKVEIYPDTISLIPKEKYRFSAEVFGTDSKECRWSITEPNGGQIDMNGVYEAPMNEGVFEVVVESVRYPNKKAMAFVIVREK